MFSARQFLLGMYTQSGDMSLKAALRRHVELVLAKTEGQVQEAAEILGIAPCTVYKWLSRWAYEDGAVCVDAPQPGACLREHVGPKGMT